ncbi:MAG: thioredoxin family protein [Akkermansiaceae bacterium]
MFRLILALTLLCPLQGAWLKNLDEAKKQAAEEKKDVFLVFLSTGISGACVQFNERVISQGLFQQAIADRFVPVLLDVPLKQTPGMVSPLATNRIVAEKFGVDRYPTTVYLNSEGVIYARETGAAIDGPLKHAAKVIRRSKAQVARLKSIDEAYQKDGREKAEALVELLKSTPRGADPSLNAEHLEELAKLDPEDTLGFRKAHLAEKGFVNLDRAIKEVFHKDSYEEVVKLVDGYLAEFDPKGSLLQKALFPKLAALNHGRQIEEAIKAAETVIAVDANSSHGKLAAQILKRLKSR